MHALVAFAFKEAQEFLANFRAGRHRFSIVTKPIPRIYADERGSKDCRKHQNLCNTEERSKRRSSRSPESHVIADIAVIGKANLTTEAQRHGENPKEEKFSIPRSFRSSRYL